MFRACARSTHTTKLALTHTFRTHSIRNIAQLYRSGFIWIAFVSFALCRLWIRLFTPKRSHTRVPNYSLSLYSIFFFWCMFRNTHKTYTHSHVHRNKFSVQCWDHVAQPTTTRTHTSNTVHSYRTLQDFTVVIYRQYARKPWTHNAKLATTTLEICIFNDTRYTHCRVECFCTIFDIQKTIALRMVYSCKL